ncbi:MAG: chalcone isomerase family protein [Planctomycetales bacterium]
MNRLAIPLCWVLLVGSVRAENKAAFPAVIRVDEKQELHLTGAATRKFLRLSIYQVASYCAPSESVRDAKSLLGADVTKQLRLRMVGRVTDSLVAAGITKSVQDNDPEGRFEKETEVVVGFLKKHGLRRGDELIFTSFPGGELRCELGDESVTVVRDRFGGAIWGAYFGDMPITEAIRRGLTSQLREKGKPPAEK